MHLAHFHFHSVAICKLFANASHGAKFFSHLFIYCYKITRKKCIYLARDIYEAAKLKRSTYHLLSSCFPSVRIMELLSFMQNQRDSIVKMLNWKLKARARVHWAVRNSWASQSVIMDNANPRGVIVSTKLVIFLSSRNLNRKDSNLYVKAVIWNFLQHFFAIRRKIEYFHRFNNIIKHSTVCTHEQLCTHFFLWVQKQVNHSMTQMVSL